MKAKISCIIATCDRKKLLNIDINSVINQSVLPNEILIINNVKYNVIPIGIKTTIPAIKLFLIFENIDFFKDTLDIYLRITWINNKNYYQNKNCN